MSKTLVNPSNDYEITVTLAALWCFLFGCFYFAYKGVWGQAFLSGLIAICTLGLSWLIYPFFAEKIIVDHYQKNGWKIKS